MPQLPEEVSKRLSVDGSAAGSRPALASFTAPECLLLNVPVQTHTLVPTHHLQSANICPIFINAAYGATCICITSICIAKSMAAHVLVALASMEIRVKHRTPLRTSRRAPWRWRTYRPPRRLEHLA
jgi:hypothetical protein